jgi:hypothetical protein
MMALEFSFVSFEKLSCFQWKQGKFIECLEKPPPLAISFWQTMHWKRLGVGAAQKLQKLSTVIESGEKQSERGEDTIAARDDSRFIIYFSSFSMKTVVEDCAGI